MELLNGILGCQGQKMELLLITIQSTNISERWLEGKPNIEESMRATAFEVACTRSIRVKKYENVYLELLLLEMKELSFTINI